MIYMVQERFVYGWDDAGWSNDVGPLRFNTVLEAWDEVDEFLAEANEAFRAGDMTDSYHREDFRVVPDKRAHLRSDTGE